MLPETRGGGFPKLRSAFKGGILSYVGIYGVWGLGVHIGSQNLWKLPGSQGFMDPMEQGRLQRLDIMINSNISKINNET